MKVFTEILTKIVSKILVKMVSKILTKIRTEILTKMNFKILVKILRKLANSRDLSWKENRRKMQHVDDISRFLFSVMKKQTGLNSSSLSRGIFRLLILL